MHAGILSLRGAIGLLLTLCVVAMALFAPLIAPHDPLNSELSMRLKPPFWYPNATPTYLLGTDALGRDLLSRVVFGSRISIMVAAVAVVVSGTFGVIVGLLSGYYTGLFDQVVQRIVEIQQAFPFILLAIVVLVVLRPSLANVIIVLVLSSWVIYTRMVRAQTLILREREFVLAARSFGSSDWRIMFRHILPNLIPMIVVLATFQTAQLLLIEAVISFLGLGIPPPTPTWGRTISEGREYLDRAWWITTFPGFALMLTVVGIGFLGDWLRDLLDPTLRM
ncbi:MAG TPA: peptide ABC transporter permease [Chloroflexi bacterium]|nr:peptide ABC transporter permease [Chloroflexota bacterium]